jgi:hypothetical protein
MPTYLSVHTHRDRGQLESVAGLAIVASEISRWAATRSINLDVRASGLSAGTHKYVMFADYPDDDAALAMAVHLDVHLGVTTELTRMISLGELRALADRSGDEFGGIE